MSAEPSGPSAPPAPWRTTASGIVWLFRAAAPHSGPRGIRTPFGVAAVIHYEQTPVGPYSEVLASPVVQFHKLQPSVSVPFIAVDSELSVVGGRRNWSLPKTLALFAWSSEVQTRASADDWSVAVHGSAAGPRLPIVGLGWLRQPGLDGGLRTAQVRARGWGRLATVQVDVDGSELSTWLPSGRHRGVVVERADVVIGRPSS